MKRHGTVTKATLAGASLIVAALATAFTAAAQPSAGPNLIVNGNAEQGESGDGYAVVAEIPGWTRKGKFTVARYGSPNGFPDASIQGKVRGGNSFFAGGPENPGSSVSQDIDLTPKKGLVDRGKLRATLSGYIGGFATQNDSLIATAIFRSQAGKRLGSIRIGPVTAAARNNATGMLLQKATASVPKQTRSIRIVLGATRLGGAYNDGYADNLSLTLGG